MYDHRESDAMLSSWWQDRLRDLDPARRRAVHHRMLQLDALGVTATPAILDELIAQVERDIVEDIEREQALAERTAFANAERLKAARQRERVQQAVLKDPRALVYYLRFADRVKIGTTIALAQRLRSIPHDELLALEPGSYDVEFKRHEQFAALRVTGEWFRYEEPLTTHIENLKAASPAA